MQKFIVFVNYGGNGTSSSRLGVIYFCDAENDGNFIKWEKKEKMLAIDADDCKTILGYIHFLFVFSEFEHVSCMNFLKQTRPHKCLRA